MINFKLQYLKCKEGLIVKRGEVDISRISAVVKLIQSAWTLVRNHKAEHAVRPKWALVMHESPTK